MDNATLTRFFIVHVLMPIILVRLLGLHITLLHMGGTASPLRMSVQSTMRISFRNLFVAKDRLNVLVLYGTVITFLGYPFMTLDPDNYFIADIIHSPLHIKPEWYYLHLFAMLRSLPDKLGGVIVTLLAIVGLLVLAYILYRLWLLLDCYWLRIRIIFIFMITVRLFIVGSMLVN